MEKMYLPVGSISESFEKAQAYCKHFNCIAHKPKRGSASFLIESNDAVNFFWLGANLNLKSSSSLMITPADKFL